MNDFFVGVGWGGVGGMEILSTFVPYHSLIYLQLNRAHHWLLSSYQLLHISVQSCPSITGLLISVPVTNKSEANITFGNHETQPLFNKGDVVVTGSPRVVQGPFGNAVSCTKLDRVVYRFDVVEPFPCPFDILQCRSGFTMSFLIHLKNATMGNYRNYLKMGNSIIVKKNVIPHLVRFNMLADNYKWYNEVIVSGEWDHIAVIWKPTGSLSYVNGQKISKHARHYSGVSASVSKELQFSDSNPGEFSIGKVQLWSGVKPPVFIWRLYQEGLVEAWSVPSYQRFWYMFISGCLPFFCPFSRLFHVSSSLLVVIFCLSPFFDSPTSATCSVMEIAITCELRIHIVFQHADTM